VSIEAPILERVVKRDRAVVFVGLGVVSGAAWLYIFAGAGTPSMMDVAAEWSPAYFTLMLVMWWVMMVAMMLPSAAPMVLLFATVNRNARAKGQAYVPTGIFVAGYLAAWGGFSFVATALQWGLEGMALVTPMMKVSSAYFGGALLIGAGIYQLTPLKQACLRHCRSPLDFLMHHWRRGPLGAFRMGLGHGLFCLGCCWVLMALLFYGGVMNLWWIAGLALYVMIEKFAPFGHRVGQFTGFLLIAWGGWIFFEAIQIV
jgi:predicted metal-binding membrane protein